MLAAAAAAENTLILLLLRSVEAAVEAGGRRRIILRVSLPIMITQWVLQVQQEQEPHKAVTEETPRGLLMVDLRSPQVEAVAAMEAHTTQIEQEAGLQEELVVDSLGVLERAEGMGGVCQRQWQRAVRAVIR